MTHVINAVIAVAMLAASAGVGAWGVGFLLRRVASTPPSPGVLSGGRIIGILERLAVTGAVLAGYPEAVAVVIAIKGLGRYPELRGEDAERRGAAAEGFIIGTLASFFWAALCGVIGLWLRR